MKTSILAIILAVVLVDVGYEKIVFLVPFIFVYFRYDFLFILLNAFLLFLLEGAVFNELHLD